MHGCACVYVLCVVGVCVCFLVCFGSSPLVTIFAVCDIPIDWSYFGGRCLKVPYEEAVKILSNSQTTALLSVPV